MINKNEPKAIRRLFLSLRTKYFYRLFLGGSVISACTIHDLRWVKVPGTGPL